MDYHGRRYKVMRTHILRLLLLNYTERCNVTPKDYILEKNTRILFSKLLVDVKNEVIVFLVNGIIIFFEKVCSHHPAIPSIVTFFVTKLTQ